jgi:hypothetical protein
MKKSNLSCVEGLPLGCAQFEADQVHLTAASGQIFLKNLLKNSETFFDAPTINLEEEDAEAMDDDQEEIGPMERLERRRAT